MYLTARSQGVAGVPVSARKMITFIALYENFILESQDVVPFRSMRAFA